MLADDIEAVIDAAKHCKLRERPSGVPLNRISSCPASKRQLKVAIKERMRLLAAAYVSLATFVPDEDVDAFERGQDKERLRRVIVGVSREMRKLRREIEGFKPFASTAQGGNR
jgi:hypothetical protein